MITSKEALEQIMEKYIFYVPARSEGKEHLSNCLNIIAKDLERLEKLEDFSKLCLTKYVPLDCMSPVIWNSKEEWLEDMSYDYYLYLCDDVCEYVVKDNIKLTPKEFKLVYELLKEVLGNE